MALLSAMGVPWCGVPIVVSDATRECNPRCGVPCVEAAHAVGDDVHAFGTDGFDLLRQLRGAQAHAAGRREACQVHGVPERLETLSYADEVVAPSQAQAYRRKPEVAVRKHDGMARRRRPRQDDERRVTLTHAH
jgi:hypothetical protein